MKNKFYTLTITWYETGLGMHLYGGFVMADSEESARHIFDKELDLGDYIMQGLKIENGIIENKVTSFLFSPQLIKTLKIKSNEKLGWHSTFAQYHSNYS